MKNRKYRVIFYFFMCVALFLFIYSTTLKTYKDESRMAFSFVDVGQGNCVFFTAPDGSNILIDSGDFNAKDESLYPFLMKNGIFSIDYAFVTHAHADHLGGLYEILEDMEVKNAVLPKTESVNALQDAFAKRAYENHTKTHYIEAGEEYDFGGVKLTVLFPDFSLYTNNTGDENNDSLLIRVEYLGTRFLITGDLEADAEAVLIGKKDLNADVLQVGHHGSSTSSSKAFLQFVSPDYAVIPVGEGNAYGHPHHETLELLDELDIKTYRTDYKGDITFYVNEKGIDDIKFSYF
ncbi:MAG: MBL fold metallo-hydrolase [Clostridia bacterium]|nr:MBL fold metallo-hydrolase [Clostridia bacterium]